MILSIKGLFRLRATGLLVFILSVTISAQETGDAFLMGEALRLQGKLAEAEGFLKKALAENESNSRALLSLAEVVLAEGRPLEAVGYFANSNTQHAGSGLLGMARAYAKAGDAASAVYYLKQHLQSEQKEMKSRILLYPEFMDMEDQPAWRELWKQDWYTAEELRMEQTRFLLERERWAELDDLFSEARPKWSDQSEFRAIKARYLLHKGKQKEALVTLERAMEEESDQFLLEVRAELFMHTGAPEKALQDYDALLKHEPSRFELWKKRARLLSELGKHGEAMTAMRAYLTYFPDEKEALVLTGDICAAEGMNYEGLQYYNRVLQEYQDDPQIYIKRANVYAQTSSWSFAIKDYSMALDLDPENPLSWFHKAEAGIALGDMETACFDLRQAYRLGYTRAAPLINKHCLHRSP